MHLKIRGPPSRSECVKLIPNSLRKLTRNHTRSKQCGEYGYGARSHLPEKKEFLSRTLHRAGDCKIRGHSGVVGHTARVPQHEREKVASFTPNRPAVLHKPVPAGSKPDDNMREIVVNATETSLHGSFAMRLVHLAVDRGDIQYEDKELAEHRHKPLKRNPRLVQRFQIQTFPRRMTTCTDAYLQNAQSVAHPPHAVGSSSETIFFAAALQLKKLSY